MGPKDKKLLFESFEDRRSAILVGFFCLLYFGVMYLPESKWIAKILPLWPVSIFGWIAAASFVAEVIVWKAFKHFYPGWYKNGLTYLLFLCEYGLLLFTIIFFSWPLFWLFRFMTASRGTI